MRKLTRLFLSALLVPGSLTLVGMQSKTGPHPAPPFAIENFPPYFDDNLAIWTQFILGFREQPRN